jgi:hypothetical protein
MCLENLFITATSVHKMGNFCYFSLFDNFRLVIISTPKRAEAKFFSDERLLENFIFIVSIEK